MTKQPINPEDIRAGDLIRQEDDTKDLGVQTRHLTAVEFRASSDGYLFWHRSHPAFLLDRPVKLPTKPYAVVAPKPCDASLEPPFVLDVTDCAGLVWFQGSVETPDEVVESAIRDGWRVVYEGEGAE